MICLRRLIAIALLLPLLIGCQTLGPAPSPVDMSKSIVTGKSRSQLLDLIRRFEGRCIHWNYDKSICLANILNVTSGGFDHNRSTSLIANITRESTRHSFDTRPVYSREGVYNYRVSGIQFYGEAMALEFYGLWEALYQSNK